MRKDQYLAERRAAKERKDRIAARKVGVDRARLLRASNQEPHQMNLPPLPEYLKPENIKWWLEDNTDADISAEFQKYGEACLQQALEEAAQKCEAMKGDKWVPLEAALTCAAAIRSMK